MEMFNPSRITRTKRRTFHDHCSIRHPHSLRPELLWPAKSALDNSKFTQPPGTIPFSLPASQPPLWFIPQLFQLLFGVLLNPFSKFLSGSSVCREHLQRLPGIFSCEISLSIREIRIGKAVIDVCGIGIRGGIQFQNLNRAFVVSFLQMLVTN